jgi:hypothetical protein
MMLLLFNQIGRQSAASGGETKRGGRVRQGAAPVFSRGDDVGALSCSPVGESLG